MDITEEEAIEVIGHFSCKGYTSIDFPDFCTGMQDVLFDEESSLYHMRLVFEQLDTDGDGLVGADDIVELFHLHGVDITTSEGMENVAKVSSTFSGGLFDFGDFKRFCEGLWCDELKACDEKCADQCFEYRSYMGY